MYFWLPQVPIAECIDTCNSVILAFLSVFLFEILIISDKNDVRAIYVLRHHFCFEGQLMVLFWLLHETSFLYGTDMYGWYIQIKE